MHVRKRNGALEPVTVDKIIRAVQRSAVGLSHVDPMRVEALGRQIRRANARRHQFTGGHDARAQAIAHFADQVHAGGHSSQVGKMTFEFWADRDPEVAGKPSTKQLIHFRLADDIAAAMQPKQDGHRARCRFRPIKPHTDARETGVANLDIAGSFGCAQEAQAQANEPERPGAEGDGRGLRGILLQIGMDICEPGLHRLPRLRR